jgi:hypothetical protein
MNAIDEAPKKIRKPTESQYRAAKIEEALMCCPPIYPCADCGWPNVRGYSCHYCGSAYPEHGTPPEERPRKKR